MDSLPEPAMPDVTALREINLDPLPPPETVFIYVLADPRTGIIRYVGKARDLRKRLSEHLFDGKCNSHIPGGRREWLGDLGDCGLTPRMFVLESVPSALGRKREQEWIRFFVEQGLRLTNYEMRQFHIK